VAQPTINPWVTSPPPAPQDSGPDGSAPRPARTLLPQPGAVPAPREGLAWIQVPPATPATGAPRWWWAGCHGGAGLSTLAAAAPGTGQVRGWPAPPRPGFARAVLVARTHAAGLLAAQRAAAQWAAGAVPGNVELLGAVLVADAPGRLPAPLRELAELVRGGMPRSWLVPYLPALRFGPDPESLAAPPIRALAAELEKLTQGERRA
jgi:hypothetical protein